MTDTMYSSPDLGLAPDQSAPTSTSGPGTADLSELKSSAIERLTSERDKLTETLRTFTEELRGMQAASQDPGAATSLVSQVADRADQVITYVEDRDPEQLLSEVRTYASAHPGLFLAGAAVAGGVLGRITRTAATAAKDLSSTPSEATDSAVADPVDSRGSLGMRTVNGR